MSCKQYLSFRHDYDKLTCLYEKHAMKNRIRVLRAEKAWSQAELADRVRVSRNSINAIENGRFDPSLPLAFRIAAAFGLSVEEVFDKTDV
jgi:putative transcriptional regulator